MPSNSDDFYFQTLSEDSKAARHSVAAMAAAPEAGVRFLEENEVSDEVYSLRDLPVTADYSKSISAGATATPFGGMYEEKYPLAPRQMPNFFGRVAQGTADFHTRDLPNMLATTADSVAGIGSALSFSFPGFGFVGMNKEQLEQYKAAELTMAAHLTKSRQSRHAMMQYADARSAAEIGAVNDQLDYLAVRSLFPTAYSWFLGGSVGGSAKLMSFISDEIKLVNTLSEVAKGVQAGAAAASGAAAAEQAVSKAAIMSFLSGATEGFQSGASITSEAFAQGQPLGQAVAEGAIVGAAVGEVGKLSMDQILRVDTPVKQVMRDWFGALPTRRASVAEGAIAGFVSEASTEAAQTGLIEEPARVRFGLSNSTLGEIGAATRQAGIVGGVVGSGFGAIGGSGKFDEVYTLANLANVESLRGNIHGKEAQKKSVAFDKKLAETIAEDKGVSFEEARQIGDEFRAALMNQFYQGIQNNLGEVRPLGTESVMQAYVRSQNAKEKKLNSIAQQVSFIEGQAPLTMDEVNNTLAGIESGSLDAELENIAASLKVTRGKKEVTPDAPLTAEEIQKRKDKTKEQLTTVLKELKQLAEKDIPAAESALKVALNEDSLAAPKKGKSAPTEDDIEAWLNTQEEFNTQRKGETYEAFEARREAGKKKAVNALKKGGAVAVSKKADAANAKLDELTLRRDELHRAITRLSSGEGTMDLTDGKVVVDTTQPLPVEKQAGKLTDAMTKLRAVQDKTASAVKTTITKSMDLVRDYVGKASLPHDVSLEITNAVSRIVAENGTITQEMVDNLNTALATAKRIQIQRLYQDAVKTQVGNLQANIEEGRLFKDQQLLADLVGKTYDMLMRGKNAEEITATAQKAVDSYRASQAVAKDPRYTPAQREAAQVAVTPFSPSAELWIDYLAAARYFLEEPSARGMPFTTEELRELNDMTQQINVVGKRNLQNRRDDQNRALYSEIAVPVLDGLKKTVGWLAEEFNKNPDKNALGYVGKTLHAMDRFRKVFLVHGVAGRRQFRFPMEALRDSLAKMGGRESFMNKYLNANAAERAREILETQLVSGICPIFGATTREEIANIIRDDANYDTVTINTKRVLSDGTTFKPTYTRAQLRMLQSYFGLPGMPENPIAADVEEAMGITKDMMEQAWKDMSGTPGIPDADRRMIEGQLQSYAKMYDMLNDMHVRTTGTYLNKVEFYTRLYRRSVTRTEVDPEAEAVENRYGFLPTELADRVSDIMGSTEDIESSMRQSLTGTARKRGTKVSIGSTKARIKNAADFDIRPDYQVIFDYALDVAKYVAFTPLVRNMAVVFDQFNEESLLYNDLPKAIEKGGDAVRQHFAATRAVLRDLIDVMSNGEASDPLVQSKRGASFLGLTATFMVSSLKQFFVQQSSLLPALLKEDPAYTAELPGAFAALIATNDPLMTAIRETDMMKSRFAGKLSRETEIVRQFVEKLQNEGMTKDERTRYVNKHAPEVMKWMTLAVRHGDLFSSSVVAYSVAKAEIARGMSRGEAVAKGLKVVAETQQSTDLHLNLGMTRRGGPFFSAMFLFTQSGFIMTNAVASAQRDGASGVMAPKDVARVVLSMVVLQGILETLLRGLDPEDRDLALEDQTLFGLRMAFTGFVNVPYIGGLFGAIGDRVSSGVLAASDDKDKKKLAAKLKSGVYQNMYRGGLSMASVPGYFVQNANMFFTDLEKAAEYRKELDKQISMGFSPSEKDIQGAYRYYVDAAFRLTKFLPLTPASLLSDARVTVGANYAGIAAKGVTEAAGGDPYAEWHERLFGAVSGFYGESPSRIEKVRGEDEKD